MHKNFYLNPSFICSPLYDNWFKQFYPQKSLLLCSPYIKKPALDQLISLYNLNQRGPDFQLKVLIRGNEEEFTHQKSSDISIFDSLLSLGETCDLTVRRITNLHMKAYLIDEQYLLISSGNLTNSGIFALSGKENFEGGISLRDPGILLEFFRYFEQIWAQSQPLESFYGELLTAYESYIKTDYSDHQVFLRLNRSIYRFPSKTVLDTSTRHQPPERDSHLSPAPSMLQRLNTTPPPAEPPSCPHQSFSLDDIPPVGRLTHIPVVLDIVAQHPDGISYLDLGRKLRPHFSENISNTDGANRKFGEEKGKFAAFLDLVLIEQVGQGHRIKLSRLGATYQKLSPPDQNRLMKDVFFDKPIVVSIMRQSLSVPSFHLLDFLLENCVGATPSTLSRKVGPLKDLFSYIQSICTDDELHQALSL